MPVHITHITSNMHAETGSGNGTDGNTGTLSRIHYIYNICRKAGRDVPGPRPRGTCLTLRGAAGGATPRARCALTSVNNGRPPRGRAHGTPLKGTAEGADLAGLQNFTGRPDRYNAQACQ